MNQTIKSSDIEIRNEVLREILWEPRMQDTDVGVQVKHRVVTLVGPVDSWSKKQAACEAAHRVPGVLDVANDIEVRIPAAWMRSDAEIAEAVREALVWNAHVPHEHILSTVVNGWVTLEGHVDSGYQRDEITRCVEHLTGVRAVRNEVLVRPKSAVGAPQIRAAIQAALARQTEREVKRIEVHVDSGIVTLSGTVRSWSEKSAIDRLAAHTRGVQRVRNDLVVDPCA